MNHLSSLFSFRNADRFSPSNQVLVFYDLSSITQLRFYRELPNLIQSLYGVCELRELTFYIKGTTIFLQYRQVNISLFPQKKPAECCIIILTPLILRTDIISFPCAYPVSLRSVLSNFKEGNDSYVRNHGMDRLAKGSDFVPFPTRKYDRNVG